MSFHQVEYHDVCFFFEVGDVIVNAAFFSLFVHSDIGFELFVVKPADAH